jgi:hypothetical protein
VRGPAPRGSGAGGRPPGPWLSGWVLAGAAPDGNDPSTASLARCLTTISACSLPRLKWGVVYQLNHMGVPYH